MQLSAISSSQGFTGRQRTQKQIDNIILRDDKELQNIAYRYALKRDNKRQKKVNRMYNSIPLVAAATVGILHKGPAKLFNKEVTGLAAKGLQATKAGGFWAMLLGAAGAVRLATAGTAKSSDKAKDFMKKHPTLTFIGQLGAMFGVVSLVTRGGAKIANMVKPEYIAQAGRGLEQVAEQVNKVKAPKFAKSIGKAISSHTPDVIKNSAKFMLAWAPEMTAFAAFMTSIRSNVSAVSDFNNMYLQLKNRQLNLAQSRIQDLQS